MNRYKLSKAGVSVSEGVRRFGGNAEKFGQLLDSFEKDPHFAQMCDAVAAGDADAAFAAGHALKGIAGNLSMTRLYADVIPLVEALRAGDLTGIDALLTPVRQDYQELLIALKGGV